MRYRASPPERIPGGWKIRPLVDLRKPEAPCRRRCRAVPDALCREICFRLGVQP